LTKLNFARRVNLSQGDGQVHEATIFVRAGFAVLADALLAIGSFHRSDEPARLPKPRVVSF